MNQQITIKRGDTRNAISTPLLKNGTAVDLTGCTVLFYMDAIVVGGFAQVVGNNAVYPVEEGMVNEGGLFKAEFKVTYPDGRKDTFPNHDFIYILIENDLGGK